MLQITICYANFLEKDGPITRRERKTYLLWAYRLISPNWILMMRLIDNVHVDVKCWCFCRFECTCEDCRLTGAPAKVNAVSCQPEEVIFFHYHFLPLLSSPIIIFYHSCFCFLPNQQRFDFMQVADQLRRRLVRLASAPFSVDPLFYYFTLLITWVCR